VLVWEGASDDRVELTLLDGAAMRRLNRRATGRRGLTDVITFSLPQPDGTLVGDVYICPEAARHWVKGRGRVKSRGRVKGPGRVKGRGRAKGDGVVEELIRLAVHGTLHVLGFDHPEGPGRTRTAMWHRQERYVRRLTDGVR
jgi:probable rRNA maturation factor